MQDIQDSLGRVDATGSFTAETGGVYASHLKRALDLVMVALLAPLALIVVAVSLALVRLDGGPGFFGHVRIGRNGRPFTCWKIRTMHPDAGPRLAALLATDPLAARAWEFQQKLDADPRVTPLGRVLRRLSIDELPQLWNVARGEMSIVGPRPVTASELDRYGTRRRFYLSCRPGLTGLWQVSGRSSLSYEDRVSLDQLYAERIGLLSDLSVLARTVPAVLRMTGI
jgi:exopolysaccharide production protein ExoY